MCRWGACCVLIALAASWARADGPPASSNSGGQAPADLGPRKSIHELELERWKAAEARGWKPPVDRAATPRAPRGPRLASPSREVHGYHPYWLGASYLTYDWSLLTSVAFFGLELDGSGAITNAHGWPWNGLVTTAHENGVRVLVTAILQSASALDALLGSATNRQAATASIVSAVVAGSADGVSVDFEQVPGSRKQALVTFLGELHAALLGAVPGAHLEIATPAVDWSNAFDYDALAAQCDHLVVMAYDYHWSGSSTTGPVAPLAGWGTYNIGWTIDDYVTWGAPRSKMLLGVPYYGYRWPSASGSAGAATLGTGSAFTYSSMVDEAALHGRLWDDASSTPWYRELTSTWRQGWYDDDASLGAKYAVTVGEELAGVSIWALGYDGTRPELWAALAAAFPPTSTPEGPPVSLRSGPNPFRDAISFRLGPVSGPARLTILDVRGRRLREFLPVAASGDVSIRWDGRDAAGRPVASGVYVVRLETGGHVHTERIARLR